MKKIIPVLMICILFLCACGKKGPVRPIDSVPVSQPCPTCETNEQQINKL